MGADCPDGGRLIAADFLSRLGAAAPVAEAAAVALVAAHPDDETVGAGAQLPRLPDAWVLHLTDGAPRNMADARSAGFSTREAYAEARRRELETAMALAGVALDRIVGFGVADQEASRRLSELARRLAHFFVKRRVEIVLTHPYEGGHPDHDATAFAVHAACAWIAQSGGAAPAIVEMASYHAGPDGLETHAFLPDSGGPALTLWLDEAQQALKRRMLACFATQAQTLAQFQVEVERFRSAPLRDFTRPPHAGRLWYERFDWGMTGEVWRRLAVEALGDLGLRPASSSSSSSGVGGREVVSGVRVLAPTPSRAAGEGAFHESRLDGAEALTILSVAFPFAPVGPDAVGGSEQVLCHLDTALVAAGHRSIVVACEGSQTAGRLLLVPATAGPVDDRARAEAQERHCRAIETALDRWPVDLIHMHGLDFHTYLPPPGVPVLVTVHLPPSWYPTAAFAPNRPDTWLHAVSNSQQRAFPPEGPVLPPIENGVPVDQLAARHAKRGFALCLGRICPEKGFHIALDAARRVGRLLLLAGQVFPYEAHERYFRTEIAPRLDRERRVVGPVDFARKRRLLTAARCLLVPSLAPETSSLVAMEALACGTPVIAFPAGALAEIVEHGRTGFLVAGEGEMADAIEAAGGLDPDTCRAVARQRFSLDRMVRRYFELYRRLARVAA